MVFSMETSEFKAPDVDISQLLADNANKELKMYISSVEKTDDGCVYWIKDKICYGICFKQAQNCETDGQVESILLALDLLGKDLDQLEEELQ